MYRVLYKLLVSLWLLVTINCGSTGGGSTKPHLPQEEVNAVNALFARLKNPFRELAANISDDCGVNLKNEIKCNCSLENHTICRVTEIDLSSHDLRGQIPAEIGNLAHLTVLDLRDNKLHGSIPKSFGNLSQLSYLNLSGNKLRGSIPKSFGNLSQLSYLQLVDNYLEGPMPPCLGELKSLELIDLSDNWFNGSIPSALGALPSLTFLWLGNNVLSGPIPYELGNASSLQQLGLYNNRLLGQLPHQLGNLKNMQIMYLEDNEFTGELPPSFKELKNLSVFHIRGNNFRGPIPEYIANWEQLIVLNLMGNNFEGSLPTVIPSLNLEYLRVNGLTAGPRGGRDFSFPNVTRMTSLTSLTLRNCSLIGPIPDFIWQLPSLSYLDLSFNNLTGGIPNVVNRQFWNTIFLKGNNLTGSLPGWLTSLNDSYVDVSENFFTNAAITPGNISKNLNLFLCCSNMTTMPAKWQEGQEVYHNCNKTLNDHLYINCGGEQVSINGSSYEADLQPDGGSTFALSDSKHWAYSSMGAFLGVDRNKYIVQKTCNISMVDAPLYTTARVSPISLKYYGFCLKNDLYTVKLHFAEIAWEVMRNTSSKGKRVFDVEIQGEKKLSNFNIEAEAGGLNKDKTKEFNVSVNDTRLEIHLYWTGKGSIDTVKYYGPLISAISVSPVQRNKASSKLSVVHIVGIVGSLLLFFILILGVLWKLGCFGGKKLHDEELNRIELFPGGVFNFRQIKAATLNFSNANKLGEGGFGTVYKGILPNGTVIAVKQLSARSKQGIREFVNEIGTISALQHPHLVRLMGCCAEDNQLLLVYEYMENNSLAHALFGPEELKLRLNWPTRVKICLGIAKGLAFLHEESKLKIVHRDIKPTNILLDKDFNAKISDFGFAKLYEEEKTHVITRVAGTTGYMAPEYAMRGYLTDKADVYSFGVVTLEIISGKNSAIYRPNDQSVYLLDLAYVLQEQGNLIELVDSTLRSDYSWKKAATILDLAMMCTNPSPTLRPTMSEVVKIMEGKSKIITSKISAPYPMDEFTTAKAIAALAQSSQSGSTSQEGASNTTLSHSVSKEIEESTSSVDYAAEMINGQRGISATETS